MVLVYEYIYRCWRIAILYRYCIKCIDIESVWRSPSSFLDGGTCAIDRLHSHSPEKRGRKMLIWFDSIWFNRNYNGAVCTRTWTGTHIHTHTPSMPRRQNLTVYFSWLKSTPPIYEKRYKYIDWAISDGFFSLLFLSFSLLLVCSTGVSIFAGLNNATHVTLHPLERYRWVRAK